MPDRRALKALLWKEFRSWWQLAAILAILPPVLIPSASVFPQGSLLRVLLSGSAAFTFLMLLVMWGAMKPVGEKNAAEFADTYLPVKPHIRWITSFVLPILVVAALGAWYGLWQSMLYEWKGAATTAWAGLLLALCAFCIPYLLSAAVSRWPSMLIGVWFAVPAALVLRSGEEAARANARGFGLLLAGLVTGVLVFDLLLRKWPLRLRQVIALLIPVATFALIVYTLQSRGDWTPYRHYQSPRIDSSDWARYVRPVGDKPSKYDVMKLEFRNYRTNALVLRRFKCAAVPIDFLGEDRVYMVQQLPRESDTSVVEWNTRLDRVRKVASLPTCKFAFVNGFHNWPSGFVRPDGRYMVLAIASMAGFGQDLWVVDLVSGVGAIAAPNVHYANDSIRWVGDFATLYGEGKAVRVDLKSVTACAITVADEGVKQ